MPQLLPPKKTSWHRLRQTTSVAFTASDDLQRTETLSKPAVADSMLGSISDLFSANNGLNPFATNNAPVDVYEKNTTGGSLLYLTCFIVFVFSNQSFTSYRPYYR